MSPVSTSTYRVLLSFFLTLFDRSYGVTGTSFQTHKENVVNKCVINKCKLRVC